ncbi:MAG: N-acetylmuramoyl-L-alanine amidase [Nitratireductor sp.]
MLDNVPCRPNLFERAASWRLVAMVIAAILSVLMPVALHAQVANADRVAASAYRMAGDATRMRVVIEFDRAPPLKWFLLRAPHRLVIDLPETAFGFDSKALDPRGLVKEVRYGNLGDGRSRIILASDGPFAVEKLAIRKNEDGAGHRMMLDLVAASEREFEQAMAELAQAAGSTIAQDKRDRLITAQRDADRKFTIVLDPGHGGIDGGAEGVRGTAEKDLTLSFCKELHAALEKTGRYQVFMTRTEDVFLRLDERVRIARQHEADLFISVHADSIRYPHIRCATVYTFSEQASDEIARAAVIRENLADSLAGIESPEQSQQVTDILVDLVRRETLGFSVSFARALVDRLDQTIEMIKNPHRSGAYRVLRAPDVPSVLVELGYLSNPKDEAQLLDVDWRKRAVGSLIEAIASYAAMAGGARG